MKKIQTLPQAEDITGAASYYMLMWCGKTKGAKSYLKKTTADKAYIIAMGHKTKSNVELREIKKSEKTSKENLKSPVKYNREEKGKYPPKRYQEVLKMKKQAKKPAVKEEVLEKKGLKKKEVKAPKEERKPAVKEEVLEKKGLKKKEVKASKEEKKATRGDLVMKFLGRKRKAFSVKDISIAVEMDNIPNLHAVIDSLVKKGLVTKQVVKRDDGRKVTLVSRAA